MDPLEYFDEEYNKSQDLINNITSFFIQSKDNYSTLSEAYSKIIDLYSSKTLTIETMQSLLKLFEDFIHRLGETVSSLLQFQDSLVNIHNKNL